MLIKAMASFRNLCVRLSFLSTTMRVYNHSEVPSVIEMRLAHIFIAHNYKTAALLSKSCSGSLLQRLPHMHTKWSMRFWVLEPIHLTSLCISYPLDSKPGIALLISARYCISYKDWSLWEPHIYYFGRTCLCHGNYRLRLSMTYVLHACSCFSSTGGFIIVYLRTCLYCT